VRQPYVVPRRRLFFAVWLTVVALPILLIDDIPRTDAGAASAQAVSADAIDTATTVPVAPPTTGTTGADGASAAPSSTVADPPSTAPRAETARARPRATTTTSTSTTTTPPTTAGPANQHEGGASWYAYNPGECAHPTAPMGTVMTVTRTATGASISCVVTDRGPHGAGRIIDLDRGSFAQLGDPSEGVIQVQISW
jgi:peptidoglycan lytic transglycosylase